MFHAFNNNMPSTERNTASINLHIKCIDYIVIKILKQIHCQIPVIFFYMILPMRVKMEMKTIHMMISSRLHSSFNRTSLFFCRLKKLPYWNDHMEGIWNHESNITGTLEVCSFPLKDMTDKLIQPAD